MTLWMRLRSGTEWKKWIMQNFAEKRSVLPYERFSAARRRPRTRSGDRAGQPSPRMGRAGSHIAPRALRGHAEIVDHARFRHEMGSDVKVRAAFGRKTPVARGLIVSLGPRATGPRPRDLMSSRGRCARSPKILDHEAFRRKSSKSAG